MSVELRWMPGPSLLRGGGAWKSKIHFTCFYYGKSHKSVSVICWRICLLAMTCNKNERTHLCAGETWCFFSIDPPNMNDANDYLVDQTPLEISWFLAQHWKGCRNPRHWISTVSTANLSLWPCDQRIWWAFLWVSPRDANVHAAAPSEPQGGHGFSSGDPSRPSRKRIITVVPSPFNTGDIDNT